MQPVRARLSTEARQAEIVDTVLDLSASVSPGDITTVDIARSLGLTQGALFKHFPSKDAIWLAVMGWVESHLLSALDAAALAAPTPLEGLRAVFMKHARFVAKHPGVPRLILNELQKPRDTPIKRRARSMQESYRKLVVRLLAEAQGRGEVAAGLDKEGAATLLIGAVQGLMLQAMLAGSTTKLEAEARRVFALYLNAIREPS
jgi:AcrR family transcriptional regulator